MHMSISTHFFYLCLVALILKADVPKLEVILFMVKSNCDFMNGPVSDVPSLQFISHAVSCG